MNNRKRKNKVDNKYIIINDNIESKQISANDLIHIQEEAYYRALKRIEEEKNEYNSQAVASHRKYKWYEEVLIILNILLFPFKLNKRIKINEHIYDDALIMIVSGVNLFIGILLWLIGVGVMARTVYLIYLNISIYCFAYMCVAIVLMMYGAIFYLSGKTFSKENNKDKIYAYSACFIALISCIISIIALGLQYFMK